MRVPDPGAQGRGDICRRRDAARAALPQEIEQEPFRARKNAKLGKPCLQHLCVCLVTGRILDARNRLRIAVSEPRHEICRESNHGHWRDVIQPHPELRIGHRIYECSERVEQPVIGNVFVIKRGQDQHGLDAMFYSMARESDSIR